MTQINEILKIIKSNPLQEYLHLFQHQKKLSVNYFNKLNKFMNDMLNSS